MARVFVFCIGGTGLRVMKSISMLMAAGMDTKGYTVVPVLIDPHIDLEEKRNLQTLIGDYETVHNNIVMSDGKRLDPVDGFFKTEITSLSKLNGQQNDVSEPMAEKRSFSQYLNYGNLKSGDVNRFLVQTMFSQSNLDNDLSVGFKGSPNVGTVVLGDMIKGSDWFKSFCKVCQPGDRVFIISSIFGGTGASGYPLLEKTIRSSKDYPNVREAIMGAVTVLPYFSLDDPSINDSDIDSANFLTKAKSALAYYEKTVQSDYLYYIGEQEMKTTYTNDEKVQDDKAHFIELIAASAFFNFLTKADRPERKQALSRAIKENKDSLNLYHLGEAYSDLVKAVADMMMLARLVNLMPDEIQFPLTKTRGFNYSFYSDKSYQSLEQFLNKFTEWYQELASNNRAFAPLDCIDPSNRKAHLSRWIEGASLEAKDDSYYLLEIIRASNKDKTKGEDHTLKFRRFIDYAYNAINNFTSKIL